MCLFLRKYHTFSDIIGCVSAESLMRILMEMEEEEEPLGGVGGGQGIAMLLTDV
jgi:hypothetical protein